MTLADLEREYIRKRGPAARAETRRAPRRGSGSTEDAVPEARRVRQGERAEGTVEEAPTDSERPPTRRPSAARRNEDLAEARGVGREPSARDGVHGLDDRALTGVATPSFPPRVRDVAVMKSISVVRRDSEVLQHRGLDSP